MMTRDEYKTYHRLKSKILSVDKAVQTDDSLYSPTVTTPQMKPPQVIILQGLPMQMTMSSRRQYIDEDKDDDDCDEDEDDDDDDDDDDSDDDEDETQETSEESQIEMSNKKRKREQVHYHGEEKEYFRSLSKRQRDTINCIEQEICDINYVSVPLRFRILESDMDMRLKAIAVSKVEQLYAIEPSSSEYMKMHTWIENLCKLPIGKYKKLPIDATKSVDDITKFLDTTKQNLDSKVFGHTDAKDQIVRLLAKWIANPESKGLVIGIEGAMGVGKTTLCNGICESLGLPFGFVQLGGISDGSYLVGHSYTYEGSRWGRIAEILMRVGCMNPVLYFDELDKISTTRHGEEIVNMLIHLTDGSQNSKFHDKYFSDIELDLSKCLIVFSYNNSELINPILKDRMISIRTEGYTLRDKMKIAQEYMLPIILKEFSLTKDDVVINDEVLNYIISQTDEEEGVRNLKRSLEDITSQINLHRLLKKNFGGTEKQLSFPLTLTKDMVDKLMSKKKEKNVSLPMMYI
jgi:ATP-dependent Lon protease